MDGYQRSAPARTSRTDHVAGEGGYSAALQPKLFLSAYPVWEPLEGSHSRRRKGVSRCGAWV